MATFNLKGGNPYELRRQLESLIRKHNRARMSRVRKAVKKAAQRTARHVKQNTVPVAFRELAESIVALSSSVVADAPHADAVEIGSRPHVPPLGPLIAWVKLRGMQGLRQISRLKKLKGPTTLQQALSVAAMFKKAERGGAVALDTPEQIARAIQAAIARKGTRPHRYMMKAIPFAQEALYEEVSEAVKDASDGD
jgi:hypothetical protein